MRRSTLAFGALTTTALLALAACQAGAPAASTRTTTESASTTSSAVPSTSSSTVPRRSTTAPHVDRLCAFRGMGTWVDVYDYVPAFSDASAPTVSAADVATMRRSGVQTLYLQVAKHDSRSPHLVTDRPRAAAFLRAAHTAGIRVVAWYLPTHGNPALDWARMRALIDFRAGGERFDGFVLDIEGIETVTDVRDRNRRVIELARQLDRFAGDRPVGAAVFPPVALDVLNPALWSSFPWRALARHVDAWFPMSYWTYRDERSPYRDAFVYTDENIRRLRAHLSDATAPVHVVGGIGDLATASDYAGFRRASQSNDAIGFSVYDFDTMDPGAWATLQAARDCRK